MIDKLELKVGCIYCGLAYEDDDLRYPIVNTYEYLGTAGGKGMHEFRFLGSGDFLELADDQLNLISGIAELSELLRGWARENPTLAT